MKAGYPTSKELTPKSGVDDRAEVEALRAAIQVFSGHTGPVAEHPFGGKFTRSDWERLHCAHIAHHLSFLIPTTPARQG